MPRRAALPLPRFIVPASIEIGDLVRVEWPSRNGVTVTRMGRVASREYVGQERVYYTRENAPLFSWNPSLPAPRVTLLERAPQPQPSLF